MSDIYLLSIATGSWYKLDEAPVDGLADVHIAMGGEIRTDGPAKLAEAHADEDAPLEWCNSVHVEFDREHDAVMVNVSTGDPRGAFQFMVARHRYHDEENDRDVDEVRMKCPHPDDAAPHELLTPLNPRGYYRIGYPGGTK